MSPEDLLSEMVAKLLSGERKWNAAIDLYWFLHQGMRSIANGERKKLARREPKRDVMRVHLESGAYDQRQQESRLLFAESTERIEERVALAAKGDPELVLYASKVERSRRLTAEALGWSVDRVTAARIKLQRRMAVLFPEHQPKRRGPRKSVPESTIEVSPAVDLTATCEESAAWCFVIPNGSSACRCADARLLLTRNGHRRASLPHRTNGLLELVQLRLGHLDEDVMRARGHVAVSGLEVRKLQAVVARTERIAGETDRQ